MSRQAWALRWSGRLSEASDLISATIEGYRLSPNIFLSQALGYSAMISMYTGDLDSALRAAHEAVDLAAPYDHGLIQRLTSYCLAATLIESGDADQARTVALTAGGGTNLPLVPRGGRVETCEVLVRAELGLGRPEAAEAWAREAEAMARDPAMAVERAIAHRATARVLMARGDGEAAANVAIAAAQGAEAGGAPVEGALCRLVAGRALGQAKQREAAIAELERAEQVLAASGAFGYRDQAARELRRLGRRVPRRGTGSQPVQGLAALSEREREIAALVAKGRTNREIAAASYLSAKTVEAHLAHIFTKLGLSSRAALATIVATEDPARL